MEKRKRILALFMTLVLALGGINVGGIKAGAATSYVTAQRMTDVTTIYPDEEISVTLNVTGTPPFNVIKPNDVVLLLDKSGSMQNDNKFNTMISSAKEFVDLVDFSAHQVGIIDYSDESKVFTKSLSTNPDELKSYLDGIKMNGGTYTNVAIDKAVEMFADQGRQDAQPVILLLTDGEATKTQLALEAAQRAKDAGIVFYTIALLAPGEDPQASAPNLLLEEMATTARHHHFVLGSVGLMDIYRAIVKEIGVASAYEVNMKETLGSEFELVPNSYDNNIPRPTVENNTLTWDMQELKDDTLSLTYKVKLKDGIGAGTYNLAPNTKITYKDYAGANRSYNIANTNIIVKNYPPVITGITPDSGRITGGDTVTITGDKFLQGATVKFGSAAATNVQVVDSQTITATVPAGAQGTVKVTVTNPDRQSATCDYLYWEEPVITEVSPNNGPFEGGNNVQIRGNYFINGMKVYFGDKEATINKFYNSTYVNVVAPEADQAGPVDVKVVNPDGRTGTAVAGYTYAEKYVEKLTITSVTPNTGLITGGNTVDIKGTKMDPDVKVYFGDVEGTVKASTNKTVKTVTVPAVATAGIVDVKVVNPDGETAVLAATYEYLPIPAPSIISLSLTQGQLAGGEIVNIIGKNFQDGITVKIGNNDAVLLNYYNDTKIRVIIPKGIDPGFVDVTVTNPDGQTATLTDGYEYLPLPEEQAPTIASISPSEGLITGKDIVVITGTNFQTGLTVKVGDNEATLLNYYNENKIRVQIPAVASEREVDVTVINPSGKQATATNGYRYLPLPEEEAPTIDSISPAEGLITGKDIVYITGTNFQTGLTVKVGDNEATLLNYYNENKIRIQIPAVVSEGEVDVIVINPSGKQATVTNGYRYLPLPEEEAPTITSISLSEGELPGGEIVYIEGTNFKKGLTVKIGDNLAKLLNYYNENKIRIQIPAGIISGTVDVTVTNPSGKEAILTDGYRYKEYIPEIDSLSITSGIYNVATITYIYGKNFAPDVKVIIGGTEAELLNYYSSEKIRVIVPVVTAPEVVDVIVQNPDGAQATLSGGYEYLPIPPVPTAIISKITTTSTTGGTPITNLEINKIYYVHGENFVIKGTDKSIVRIIDAQGVIHEITPLNLYTDLKLRFLTPKTIASGPAELYIISGSSASDAYSIIIQ